MWIACRFIPPLRSVVTSVEHEQHGEQRAAYGKEVLKVLAEKLTQAFGRGFSKSNLEYMRRFFLLYQYRALITQFKTGQSKGMRR